MFTKHLAGEFDPETRMQICTLCGAVIWDDSDSRYTLDGDSVLKKGFSPGDVYISHRVDAMAGQLTTKALPIGSDFMICTPVKSPIMTTKND